MSRAERCGNAIARPESLNGFHPLSEISQPSDNRTDTDSAHVDASWSEAPTSGLDVSTAATG